MKLDIIIPHYREPWAVCHYLFDSIAMQRRIPFKEIRCIVVNDGDDTQLDGIEFGRYPFETVYLKKEHGGVSAARNYGLDHSDAEYVMFCDIDDGFLNNYGMHMIFAIMQEGFDMLCPVFLEEALAEKTNSIVLVPHKADMTFIHGKIYRRQFLIDRNLRFDEGMTLHEDGHFNMLAYIETQHGGKIRTVDTPYYLWCYNENSTVRKDGDCFTMKTYWDVMKARHGTCEQLRARGYGKEFDEAVAMTVLNSYYDFQKTEWRQEKYKKQYREAEKAFRVFWMKYKNDFNNLTNLKVAELARVARETAIKKGLLMEQDSLKDFLRHIEREVT